MADIDTLPKFNRAGEPAGTVPVPAAFSGRPHQHAIWLAVTAQMANRRTGTHSTLTKGEVSGGGKKPWKQKHTGRARQGSTRNPHWYHGGVAFGPRPHGYGKDLTAGVRRLALRSAIAAKVRGGAVAVVDAPDVQTGKTGAAAAWLSKLGVAGRSLVVLDGRDAALARAFRNIPRARVASAHDVSVYDAMAAGRVLVTAEALAALVRRCGVEESK